jgi:hypothetical protein
MYSLRASKIHIQVAMQNIKLMGFFYLNPLSLEHVKRSIAYGKAFILLDSQSEIQAIKRHRIILLTFHWKTRIWM